MPRTPNTPTVVSGDALSVGQIAKRWGKSHDFIRRMLSEGKLNTDERGRVTNESLRDFYSQHGALLDA